jgi:phosphoglucosamine mutase
MEKLFGTDGIRGVANEFPLTPEFITRIGSAISQVLGRDATRPRALIGRDTRQSGAMIENALAAGLMSRGFDTLHVGVLTTPGVAYLTRSLGARCGISISASHNPFEDNGIKVFGADGFKIPDERENEIETLAQPTSREKTSAAIGQRRDDESPITNYLDFLLDAVKHEKVLAGKRVVVDCNNGATFDLAQRTLTALGAHVIALNDQPDGVNINRGYDSLEPKLLRETVLREGADFGVQFDGDGDRAVFVDERGNYVDGDFVLAMLARDFKSRGLFAERGNAVVSTVMANIGLEKSLTEIGATLERTAVGDRWVTERMRANGALIGGEQSGHIVLFDGGHTTGDGLYTTIRVAEVLARRGEPLSVLAACMKKYPQVLVNVRVPRKPPLEQLPTIQSQVEQSRVALGDGSRIVLRYSGTENLARVMIEGDDAAMIAREAHAIAAVIQETIQ